jgi:excisionase family DNA binding protein
MLRAALMTIAEVANMLKVTPRTVGGWIRSGDLRAVKAGKDWRIAQIDLEAFLNAHANRPAHTTAAEPVAQRPIDTQIKTDGKHDTKVVGLEAWRTDKHTPRNGGDQSNGSGQHS